MFKFVRVHSEKGLTDVSFTEDGSHFVTCGNDGDIHLFNLQSDENNVEHIRCSEHCSSIVLHENHLFVGTDRNELEVRSYPDGDSLPSLAHFTQPVSTLLLFNSSIFVGTKDFRLLMIDLTIDGKEMKSFDGHEGPILSLSVHSEKKYLCSTCCDGSIRIFNIENQNLIKQWKNFFPKSNDIERSLSMMKTDWDTIDQYLSIPNKNSIEFFDIDLWNKKKTYENPSIDQLIHQIVYSPCQRIFIIGYVDGQISLIQRSNFELLFNYSHSNAICSIKWNPKFPTQFICTTFNGEYSHGNIEEYLKKSTKDQKENNSMEIDSILSTKKNKKSVKILDEDEDEDEDEEEEEEKEEEEEQEEEKKTKKKNDERFDETSMLMLMEKMKCEIQESFQVTSTSKYLESRYLVLNSIGMICCYNEQIHVKFHDVSHHHSITIDNKTKKYSLGDLSLKCVLLGSEETNEFFSLFYSNWDSSSKEFHFHLDKSDRIQLVKLTDDYLLLLTQQKLLRLFSLSGIQQRIIRYQGPIISISSFQNQLFLVHHSSQGLTKDSSISYLIIDLDEDLQYSGLLPLTSKSKINWIGYSDTGKCYYGEKSGHLSLLRRTKSNEYQSILIANLKDEAEKNHLSHYWLIGINDNHRQIQLRVIELRHQSYPDVHPTPLISILSPSIPLIPIDSEQNQLENEYLKMKIFDSNEIDEDQLNDERQCLIKMFANSCKSNREYRALEICYLMDRIALQLAIRYATKSGKLTLAQMISDKFFDENSSNEQNENFHQQKIKQIKNISSNSTNSNRNEDLVCLFDSSTKKSSDDQQTTKTNSFQNPFRRKIGTNQQNNHREKNSHQQSSINDQFSDWKPSIIGKPKFNSNGNISSLRNINSTENENENEKEKEKEKEKETDEQTLNGKRKISEEHSDEFGQTKRNKLRQFICQK